jgi:DUF4097 and DUF4098 domain-containing protein YvlB
MKRIVILILLVVAAGLAGVVVRSSSGREIRGLVAQSASGDVRDEIRQTYELAPGARVDVAGINGPVKIETADTKTAEVYIERTASSQEALNRRKINIEADGNRLSIRGETTQHNFFARLFGSRASEKVTLRLPRQISLAAKGVNGTVVVGEIAGAIELSGINGNIELQLPADLNADFEAHGMNGRVIADFPNVMIDKSRHGNYSARIGSGGSEISAKGINGNIRLTPIGGSTSQAADSRGN